jgi:hypothetical protein
MPPRREPGGIERLAGTEEAFRRTASVELDALHVAQEASVALVSMVDRFSIKADEYRTTAGLKKLAVATLSVIAFRSARACMLVISHGYVPEAFGLKRPSERARAAIVSAASSARCRRERNSPGAVE